ncbi:hypothetical protein [Escherichia coli]|uniref:Uncharacterized protein n=1 Tax=Escherichia phage 121Q TaxID=1555202 RepID=A0A097EXS0_9CAUD|nr:hypothetical protein PBI_121Q_359 [Escherichia phage 121Q]MDI0804328.1 hypothetical protein [Escherichia coli]MED6536280.1 hypothetical protein [Escherichia coli O157]QXN76082.1 hypothetical protein [Escherichia phage BF17]AIT14249.1 hypothetical protein PBI_121Q_359 [Escherichia phage 121Q]MED6562232.1 hypothetical protein [Escherichia coli O157]
MSRFSVCVVNIKSDGSLIELDVYDDDNAYGIKVQDNDVQFSSRTNFENPVQVPNFIEDEAARFQYETAYDNVHMHIIMQQSLVQLVPLFRQNIYVHELSINDVRSSVLFDTNM